LAFGDWFRYGARGNLHALEKKAFGFNAVETKALSSGTDPDGGYLVPREMETAMDRILGTVSAMRSLATVRAISGSGYRKPVNVGGTASGWVGETGGRAETTAPSISVLDFPAMELYAHPYATQTLLDDSAVNIEQWLADEVAIEFAEEEGAAFVSGNGVNKPTGVLGATTVANASYVWGKIGFVVTGAASDFATTNPIDALVTLQDALKTGYSVNGTWLMTRATQSAIRKFKDGTGNYIWQPAMQAAVAPTIFGKPVVVDDNMNELGSNLFPVAYGDFRRGYIIVDRIGIRVLRDPYSAKPYVTFYTTKRVGGGIQNFEAIKLLKCSV
jgi:HK97 family phage major capsid protein